MADGESLIDLASHVWDQTLGADSLARDIETSVGYHYSFTPPPKIVAELTDGDNAAAVRRVRAHR